MTVRVRLSEVEIRAAIADYINNHSSHAQNAHDSGSVNLFRDTSGEFIAEVEYVDKVQP